LPGKTNSALIMSGSAPKLKCGVSKKPKAARNAKQLLQQKRLGEQL
jgi:hypothetical protein